MIRRSSFVRISALNSNAGSASRAALASLALGVSMLCTTPAVVDAQEPEPVAPMVDDTDKPTAVQTPLAKQPETPEEMFEATLLMLDIDQPVLARHYLELLMKTAPGDDVLNQLRDKFGTASFLRLFNSKELQPLSTELLDASNAASARRAKDPTRIAALVAKLGGAPQEEADAIIELRNAKADAVPPLLQILADTMRARIHANVLVALIQVGEPAIPVLQAALESDNANIRSYAASALGTLEAREAIPYLWFPAVADESVAVKNSARQALAKILNVKSPSLDRLASDGLTQQLLKEAQKYDRRNVQFDRVENGKVLFWSWDKSQQMVVPLQLTTDAASDRLSLRFTHQALELSPARRDVQVRYLSLALGGEARAVKGQQLTIGEGTAFDLALASRPDLVGDVLADALASGNPRTAEAALAVLEQIGTRDQLARNGIHKSPLILALNYPDRRVQFAAATTVLQLDPAKSFPDAQRVVGILHRAIKTSHQSQAVVVQSSEKVSELAGFVKTLGFEPIVRLTGREGFVAAAARGDIDLVVLHANIIGWALTETVANLRADARTANIPIIVIGSETLRPRLESLVTTNRRITFAAETVNPQELETQVRPFLLETRGEVLAGDELDAYKSAAIRWLAHIASTRRTAIYNLADLEDDVALNLDNPELAPAALTILGEIGSAKSQRYLNDLAINAQAAPALRSRAAGKLSFHIQRYSLLLSKDDLRGLHTAYAQATEPDVRTALGGVIGSLQPSPELVGKRLKDYRLGAAAAQAPEGTPDPVAPMVDPAAPADPAAAPAEPAAPAANPNE